MKRVLTLTLALIISAFVFAPEQANAGWDEFDQIYSNAYDGYTNIRDQPSTSGRIIGRLPNGSYSADFIEVAYSNNKWYYIRYKGIYGYVAKSQVGYYPSNAVNLDITTKWLKGVWYDRAGNSLTLDNKGNFVLRGSIAAAGKWRLSGGNNLTLKGNSGYWTQTYVVDLTLGCIGDFVREGTVLPLHRAAVADTGSRSDYELSMPIYNSTIGSLPAEYQWIIGEWRSATNSAYVVEVGHKYVRIYDGTVGGVIPQNLNDIRKVEYTIGYRKNPITQRYYVAIIPADNLPVAYLDTVDHKVFFLNSQIADELIRKTSNTRIDQGSSGASGGNTLLIVGIVAVIALLLGAVVYLAVRLQKQKK